MKTLLKIFAVLLIIIIALIFILPAVYKSEIINLTKNELNKNINAKIDFEDVDLSLIKSFPNFNISIYGLSIIGNDDFSADTLISIERVSLSIDIFSVINSDKYMIKSVKLFSPSVNIKVLENGKSNYDISMPESANAIVSSNKVENANDNDIAGFQLDIDKFHISNGNLVYIDANSDIHMRLTGLTHTLSGKLSADNALLFTNTKIANLNLSYQNIPYFSNVAIVYKASINADFKNEIYTLGKNELIINELITNFDGTVSYIEEDLNLILTFNSMGNKFKDILSLVPTIYKNNFKSIQTEGKFSVSGFVKGVYNDEHIPSFNITASVYNAMFKYPDLPKSVNNINIKANISNRGGAIDNTIIDISKLDLRLGENQFISNLKISTPISDPDISTRIIGEINMAEIADFYPIGNDELSGYLNFNLKFEGQLSSIESVAISKGKNNFIAMGSILARDVIYSTPTFVDPINIVAAQLNFSPQYLDLVNLNATLGKNDIQVTGKVEDYLPYYFNSGTLGGSLIVNSNYLNIDDLLAESDDEIITSGESQGIQSVSTTAQSNSIVEIPDNINFSISAKFQKLIYDSLEMENVVGKLSVSNNTLEIHNLSMDAVEGKMIVSGNYSTVDVAKPEVDFSLNMKNLSIPVAYNQFAIIRNYLPLAKKTTGLFSANFNLSTILDNDMMPIYPTMNGGGTLSTSKIKIVDLNSLAQIVHKLKLTKFNTLEIDKIDVKFEFVDGKLQVKPTKFNYQNINAEIEGWTSFDKSIGYTLDVDIPRSEFGGDANKVLDGLLAQANSFGTNFSIPKVIPISIFIDGTLDNPKVSTSFSSNNNNTAVEQVKENIQKEINKVKEELGEEAEAKAQQIIDDADKKGKELIKEAEKQAKIIKGNAADAKKNLLNETDKQAKALIAEGKKNGFVAEMAAKEVAKQLKNEVSNNADAIIIEANKNADNIIIEAKKASKKLKADAEVQAKKVREY